MRSLMLTAIVLSFVAGQPEVAFAQITSVTNPSGYAPNMYNRSAQPLSPYLNLLRGGSTAVNYFYGVRPGTQPGAFQTMMSQLGTGPRQTFFPGADMLIDLAGDEPRDPTRIGPTGHATTFNNTLNYFGLTSGQFFTRGLMQRRGR